jgi:hypothetical protein
MTPATYSTCIATRPAERGSSVHLLFERLGRRASRHEPATTIYQLTDRLHHGHIACVPGDEIATTISAWLAELGTRSPMADELASAVRTNDWPTAYAIGEQLSVDVARRPI